MMAYQRVYILSLVVALSAFNCLAQVSQVKFAAVDDLLKCFSCCADLLLEDSSLLEAACQSGCNNLAGAIDDNVQAQAASFKAGDDFRKLGKTQFNNLNYFCSAGGSVQRVFNDVVEADCLSCCESISVNFDVNETYNVASCQAACPDGFNQDCNDLPLIADQLGCAIGLLFRQEGGANFLDGTNHFCTNLGELFSLQAIEIGKVNDENVPVASECDNCCVEIANEIGIDSAQCQIGCDPTNDCAVDAATQADCEIGKSLAKTSIARILDDTDVTCIAPGFTEKFVNLNQLNVGLKPEDFAIILGSVFGGVIALALIAWIASRRFSGKSEKNNSVPSQGPPSRFAFFGFKKDIDVISYPREKRSNAEPGTKKKGFGFFKSSEASNANDKYQPETGESKSRLNFFRFFKKKKDAEQVSDEWKPNNYSFDQQTRTDPAPRWNNDNESYRAGQRGYRDEESQYTRAESNLSPPQNRRARSPDGTPASSKLRMMASRQ